ncbi:predicted protein [Nematostella vectensis]|uniref:Uncharacterized protein n=1 Tax=Nematostella vectensis TaxID=45351 RepID=A7T360_NEMVE|nr:predicted protein [Nematostella vectensis]|eukprot:XP_001621707.1 hypothetical protein NEMVEDRAFT_v1g221665 [Nematostella vectensis]
MIIYIQRRQITEVRKADEKTKQRYKKSFDDRHGVRSLPVLEEGDQVRVKLDNEKGWKTQGRIVAADTRNRSYIVETSNSSLLKRNRRHLRPSAGIDQDIIPYELPEEEDFKSDDTQDVDDSTGAEQFDDANTRELKTRSGRTVKKPMRYIEEFYGLILRL